jgi:hypothetical protein
MLTLVAEPGICRMTWILLFFLSVHDYKSIVEIRRGIASSGSFFATIQPRKTQGNLAERSKAPG